jgi:hypothetical protein
MSCTSCQGFQHFETFVDHNLPTASEPKPSCGISQNTAGCMYTTQGELICNTNNVQYGQYAPQTLPAQKTTEGFVLNSLQDMFNFKDDKK